MNIKNGDMPIVPIVNENGHPYHASQVCFDNKPLVTGLSKREAFAMAAMQGLMANSYLANVLTDIDKVSDREAEEVLIYSAVSCADALLKELDKC